jgi:hypothetical protein
MVVQVHSSPAEQRQSDHSRKCVQMFNGGRVSG